MPSIAQCSQAGFDTTVGSTPNRHSSSRLLQVNISANFSLAFYLARSSAVIPSHPKLGIRNCPGVQSSPRSCVWSNSLSCHCQPSFPDASLFPGRGGSADSELSEREGCRELQCIDFPYASMIITLPSTHLNASREHRPLALVSLTCELFLEGGCPKGRDGQLGSYDSSS